MDREAWRAAVHGVTKSRTLMSNFHFQSEVRLQFIPLGSDHIPIFVTMAAAATAAKLLQSCSTLCDPIDGSPPGSPVPGSFLPYLTLGILLQGEILSSSLFICLLSVWIHGFQRL